MNEEVQEEQKLCHLLIFIIYGVVFSNTERDEEKEKKTDDFHEIHPTEIASTSESLTSEKEDKADTDETELRKTTESQTEAVALRNSGLRLVCPVKSKAPQASWVSVPRHHTRWWPFSGPRRPVGPLRSFAQPLDSLRRVTTHHPPPLTIAFRPVQSPRLPEPVGGPGSGHSTIQYCT